MEFTHMLDTNIVSDLIRNPAGIICERIRAVGERRVCVSIIVASEIRYGCAKKGSARLTRQAEAVLQAIPVLPMEAPADQEYARIRADLERRGLIIGPNDLLIASHARQLGLVLATDNLDEFQRIPGLRVENWLKS
jgi:tRNA(fMet)-specific endonuclease VapC